MTPPRAEQGTTPEGSQSPKSTQPTTTRPEVTGVPPLGVRQSTQSRSTSTGGSATGGGAAGGEPPSDPLDTIGSTPSESDGAGPVCPDELRKLSLRKKPLADVLRGLVLGATIVIHQTLARSEYEQSAGLWLMEESEAAGVADPLASIANRHAGDALVNPDMGDLIAAGVAAASYVVGNAWKAFTIRRAIRRAGFQTEPQDEESAT